MAQPPQLRQPRRIQRPPRPPRPPRTQRPQPSQTRKQRRQSRIPATGWEDLITALLAGSLLGGLWHVRSRPLIDLGVAVAAVWVLSRDTPPGQAVPAGYGPGLAGVLIALAGAAGDAASHAMAGPETPQVALMPVFHLLIDLGVALLLLAPVRSSWLRATVVPVRPAGWQPKHMRAFPNFMQVKRVIPVPVWHGVRAVSVASFLALCVTLFLHPAAGLFVFWKLVVPVLPLLFFVAPGLWRNLCPLAAANQTPRLFKFTRALTPPDWLRTRGHLIAVVQFLIVVGLRKILFNTDGPALALLLVVVIASAFTGGLVFKGKSGWCSSICPLLPVQRLYGQTPFVLVPNSHCQPCIGCTKNCFDFNPQVAYQADLHDPDPDWGASRKFFAGTFPGLIVAFFTVPSPPAVSVWGMYGRIALYMLVSSGSFFALDAFVRGPAGRLAALYGALALSLFYWYNAPVVAATLHQLTGWTDSTVVVWPLRAGVLTLALWWVLRTFRAERRFRETEAGGASGGAGAGKGRLPLAQAKGEPGAGANGSAGGGPGMKFSPQGKQVPAAAGASLLEVAEKGGLPIEAGCRMGMCGADPVAVLEGAEHLSEVEEDEADTLRRLGLAANTRMACCARLQGQGEVCVSLEPEQGDGGSAAAPAEYDRSIRSVVVLGGGIAGVTAADFVRRNHPDCEVHVVGLEAHPLYNRMGISRVVYGRSAMQGLYLLKDEWYEQHQITAWLNTQAQRIDLAHRQVHLATGVRLAWDRLIIATGSRCMVPKIDGYGMPGSFVLRDAGDAMAIRAFKQQQHARTAVVAGGGLLGLEAAYALHQLGLGVAVLERSGRLLRKQVDEPCSERLTAYFENLGIRIVHNAETAAVEGDGRVQRVRLKDGRVLNTDMLLVAVGIQPNKELAWVAGIEVKRGIVVDDHMRTSVPDVYACGDVAEHAGQTLGLWTTAVGQAEAAAVNATGGDREFPFTPPAVILKGTGIDMTAAGRVNPDPKRGDQVILAPAEGYTYGKLVIAADGKLAGGILLGRPDDAPKLLAGVKQELDLSDRLGVLRAGDWSALDPRWAPEPAPPVPASPGRVPAGAARR